MKPMNTRLAYLKILYFLFVVDMVVSSSDLPGNRSLYFGVFISQETDFDFSGFIPPLEWGAKTINDNQTILKGVNGDMNYFIEYEPIADAKV